MDVAYRALGSTPLVTTHEVLVETLNGMSGWGAHLRQEAARAVRTLHLRRRVTVIAQTPETFDAGLRLYEQRPDKEYSLTDCISMSTMRALGITRVLTSDHHFTQEGFEILIRRTSS